MTSQISDAVKRLPFERTLLIESKPCKRCAGTGNYGFGQPCYDCARLGRLFTKPGRELIAQIGVMLSLKAPLDPLRIGRWNEGALHLTAGEIKVGMKVGRAQIDRDKKVVTAVERLGPGGTTVRFTYANFASLATPASTFFSRELTDAEVDRAEVFMAQMLGKGAVRGDE